MIPPALGERHQEACTTSGGTLQSVQEQHSKVHGPKQESPDKNQNHLMSNVPRYIDPSTRNALTFLDQPILSTNGTKVSRPLDWARS